MPTWKEKFANFRKSKNVHQFYFILYLRDFLKYGFLPGSDETKSKFDLFMIFQEIVEQSFPF